MSEPAFPKFAVEADFEQLSAGIVVIAKAPLWLRHMDFDALGDELVLLPGWELDIMTAAMQGNWICRVLGTVNDVPMKANSEWTDLAFIEILRKFDVTEEQVGLDVVQHVLTVRTSLPAEQVQELVEEMFDLRFAALDEEEDE